MSIRSVGESTVPAEFQVAHPIRCFETPPKKVVVRRPRRRLRLSRRVVRPNRASHDRRLERLVELEERKAETLFGTTRAIADEDAPSRRLRRNADRQREIDSSVRPVREGTRASSGFYVRSAEPTDASARTR